MNAHQRRIEQRALQRRVAAYDKAIQGFLDKLPGALRSIAGMQLYGATFPAVPVRPKGLFSTYKDRQA